MHKNLNTLLIRSNPVLIENSRLPKSLSKRVGLVMPLGIASIAAYLRSKNIPVSILDAEAENLSISKIKNKIKESDADIVGITTMTPTVHNDLEVARVAKEAGKIVVFGGPHFNAMPKETIMFDFIDFGILGEGEYPMYRLIESLKHNLPLDKVPGIVYKTGNNSCFINPPFIHEDIDQIPNPAIDLLPYNKYSTIISKGVLATLSIGRGCPFKCGFCFKQPSDKKIRYRNYLYVINEIEEMIKNYGITNFNFVSDTMTLNKEFTVNLCKEIISRNIKISWISPTRIDCVEPDLLKLMKKAGCNSLRFGIESGSEKIRKFMNKNIDNEMILKAIKWTKDAGIETFCYFIIGYIGETESTIQETFDFVKKLKPDMLMYNIATPLPDTPLFKQCVDAGYVDKNYWTNFILDKNCKRIPYIFKDAEHYINIAYKKFFFSPSFLIKSLLKIRLKNFNNYIKALIGLLNLKKT